MVCSCSFSGSDRAFRATRSTAECYLSSGPARLRHGGPAGRGGEGGPGAGARRRQELRLQLPGQPHHRESGPGRARRRRARCTTCPSWWASWPPAGSCSCRRTGQRLSGGAVPVPAQLRPVAGRAAHGAGRPARWASGRCIVPAENAAEATLAGGLTVYGVETCAQLAAPPHRRGAASPPRRAWAAGAGERAACRTSPT